MFEISNSSLCPHKHTLPLLYGVEKPPGADRFAIFSSRHSFVAKQRHLFETQPRLQCTADTFTHFQVSCLQLGFCEEVLHKLLCTISLPKFKYFLARHLLIAQVRRRKTVLFESRVVPRVFPFEIIGREKFCERGWFVRQGEGGSVRLYGSVHVQKISFPSPAPKRSLLQAVPSLTNNG